MSLQRLPLFFLAALLSCAETAPKPAAPPAAPPAEMDAGTAATPPLPDPDAVAIPLRPEVTSGHLANGLSYYILKHTKPEKRALLWLAVRAGSVDEDDDQRGLAHFDEHMAFNGTSRFPKDELIKYLESIGMRFGADLNAYTTWQQTMYQLEVPTDNPAYLDKGFQILRDWAGNVTYDPAKIDTERGVVLEEWRLGRGSRERIADKEAPVVFKGSRYADRLPIGLPEILKTAKPEALTRFYKDWYRPDEMAVLVVGEIEPAGIEKMIQAQFADLKNPEQERAKPIAGVPEANGTRVSIVQDKEANATLIGINNLIQHRPESSRRDFRRVTTEALYSRMVNQRLNQIRQRADAPFLAGLNVTGSPAPEIDAYQRIAIVKGSNAEPALRVLLTEALRAERHGFSQAELERAEKNVLRQAEQAAAREATDSSRGFIEELGRHFFDHEFVAGPAAELEMTKEILPQITMEDVSAAMKAFGGAKNRVVTLSGPEGKPLPAEERVLAVIAEVEASEIGPWEDAAAPKSLMEKAPAPGKIVAEKKRDDIGVTEWTLSNGARVIVKPNDFEKDTVFIEGSAPGGTATIGDAAFNDSRYATEILAAGGVANFDPDTLTKILSGKVVRARTWISEEEQGAAADGSAHDLETIFQLLYLRISSPRLDAARANVWKSSQAENIANQELSPEFQLRKRSQEVLYSGNIRRKIPSADDFKSIDLDKALRFYKERFADLNGFTFVITGELDLEKLKPLVETYLASLPGNGRVEKEKDLGIRKVRGVVEKTWKLGIEPKASVSLDFHGDESWSREKERDLYILEQVLTIRLRERLRADLGGIYGVRVGAGISRSPHQERSVDIAFGCDPQRVDELLKAAKEELGQIAKKGIGDEYLQKVKETYLRERETQLRTNAFWLARLSNSYRYGDDPAEILDTAKTPARMTSANVQASVKKFLDAKQVYKVIRLPEDAAPAK